MSSDQPDHDPFRKRDQPEQPAEEPQTPEQPPSPPPSYDAYGGSGAPGASGSGGADPYGGGPYGGGPYGDMSGAADPLADMPPLASRGKRLVARIIDALLIGIPIGLILGLSQGNWAWDTADTGRSYLEQGVYTLVYLIYEGLMLTRSGQTVGKRLMKIRVAVLSNGEVPAGSPGWIRAVVYQLPPLVPCVGFLFWLANVLFCTWDKPFQQCLHDKAAKTVVVAAD
ncbi:MAG: RDD family protein [Streptomyces sp.]